MLWLLFVCLNIWIFEVKGGVIIKLVCSTISVFLCIYDDFCYICVIGLNFANV
jgi:hypothetical protein